MRALRSWVWLIALGCGRVPGMDLGDGAPPIADRRLRSCAADLAVSAAGADAPFHLQRWSWDADGLRTSAERDEFADGVTDITLATTFDEERRPVETTGVSDVPGNVWTESWTYDEDGYLVRYLREATLVADKLVTTEILDEEYTWDRDRIVRSVNVDSTIPTDWAWSDDGLEATLVSDISTIVRRWNKDGSLAYALESLGDGTDATEREYLYDDEHRLVGVTEDTTGDGASDATSTWSWACAR